MQKAFSLLYFFSRNTCYTMGFHVLKQTISKKWNSSLPPKFFPLQLLRNGMKNILILQKKNWESNFSLLFHKYGVDENNILKAGKKILFFLQNLPIFSRIKQFYLCLETWLSYNSKKEPIFCVFFYKFVHSDDDFLAAKNSVYGPFSSNTGKK